MSPSLETLSDVYTVLPGDLSAANEEVRHCEQEWQQAGAQVVAELQVHQTLKKANDLENEFNQAKFLSRPGLTLTYLRLARLFVLTGLPRFKQITVIMVSGAVLCGLSLLFSPFVFSSFASAMGGAFVLAVSSSSMMVGAILLLWPNERKHQSFQRLQHEWKNRKDRADALQPLVEQSWTDYKELTRHWNLCNRLEKARLRRDELAALLSSTKYQLIHSNWRALRSVDLEQFLQHVFEMLGYHVQTTKVAGDQGADLIVTGKGTKIAVQVKGYFNSVGNSAVQAVVAAMPFYQCTSCAVITNSRFTRGAVQLANANGCRLIDGNQIPELIEGRIYLAGRGVPKDDVQAEACLLNHAEQGDAAAQASLASMYQEGRGSRGRGTSLDDEQTAAWYRKAAEQGDAFAQYMLGWMYQNGCGVPTDEEKAAVWYRKAAEQGNSDAQSSLELMHNDGYLPTDEEKAAVWYRKAAQGYRDAQYQMGLMFEGGQGVTPDEDRAICWFMKAAHQGHEDAKKALRRKGVGKG